MVQGGAMTTKIDDEAGTDRAIQGLLKKRELAQRLAISNGPWTSGCRWGGCRF